MPASLTPVELLAACAVVALGATVQGTVGFGIGLVGAPLLALIDPSLVPGSILFCGLAMSILVARRERRAMDITGLKWGLIGRLLGTLAAAGVLASVPKTELTLVLGGLVLLAVALSVSGLHVRPTVWSFVGAGALSGFMSTVSSAGGPPFALLYQRASGARIRSTMSGLFLVGTIASLIALAMVGHFGRPELLASLVLLPGVLVGYALSTRALPILDRRTTRPAVLTVAAISGVAVIMRGLL